MWIRIGNWIRHTLHVIGHTLCFHRVSCVLCLVVIFCSSWCLAEETNFEATVNTNKISMLDVVELILTVHGTKGDVADIPMPAIDGFEVRYVGPSTKYLIINGVTSSEHSFIYNLFPSKIGHYQIPSISLTFDGKTYNSKPIDISVEEKLTESRNPVDAALKQQESIEDKVFLKVYLDTPKVYVGQKIPLRMKVYVKDLSLQLAAAPSLNPQGFSADATCTMRKNKETLNGVNFDTLTFDTNIYPSRSGKLAVGPFQAIGELVYRIKDTNDFFQDIFGRTETRPITLRADALSLEVQNLPVKGQPSDFNGVVGQYDFKARVGPATVKLGDPLTLHMTITGDGKFKNLGLPLLNDARFKTYDPQVKEEDNSKTFEQVIIPTDQNISEVPSLSFSYFDPNLKEYKTITQGPFPIKIVAPSKGEEFKAYGFVDKSKVIADKPIVVKFDGLKRGMIQGARPVVLIIKDWRFWSFVLFGLIGWLGFRMWLGFQLRLATDQAFARRYQASQKARKGIQEAEGLLKQLKVQDFYNVVHKTLLNFIADKLHKPVGSLNFETIQIKLSETGVTQEIQKNLKDIFDRCDHIRFAGGSIDGTMMKSDFQKLQELISYLDKKLK